MTEMTSRNRQRIVVIGGDGPLLEGVSDLLQLAGYEVRTASSWDLPASLPPSASTPPNLAILDISSSVSDNKKLSGLLASMSERFVAQILVVSFAGDDRIRELERLTQNHQNGRLHFYAHSLLGAEGLLAKVDSCFG
jgi:hypothetical protein